ncbi:MAG: (p)ppGpp synthetase [Lachnospiraceae bacterium]|nr:(p)ppGpp synthetase [Lachnospiraceae bacterium]
MADTQTNIDSYTVGVYSVGEYNEEVYTQVNDADINDITDTEIDDDSSEVLATNITDLLPVSTRKFEDMEVLSDMAEHFSTTLDPILRMYSAAMSVAMSRLEIMQDEFKYRRMRNPIHHIDSRLKSTSSILGKLKKKDLDLSLTVACNNVFDIAGIRVVCPYIKDVYLIRDRLMAQDDLIILEMKDYIENPKKNGYRSLHVIVRVPVYFMGKKQLVPVELQLRTQAMDLWASLEHDIKYKKLSRNQNGCSHSDEDIDFTAQLKEVSEMIYAAEAKLEAINSYLED